MAVRKENLNRMWKKLMKLVDLGEPTSFLHHVCLVCTQRECKSNESIIGECREIVRITNLRRSNRKVSWLGEIARAHDRLVL